MAKSSTKRRRRGGQSATRAARTSPRRRLVALIATLAVVMAASAWWAFNVDRQEADFQKLVETGKSALSGVTNVPSEGGGHLRPGQSVTYRSNPPTSGIHDPKWTEPGVHSDPQSPTRLVHALEHGNIVIYYDRPDAAVMKTLKVWAGLFRGQWSGIVLTPRPGIGKTVVLTAWKRIFRLDPFDAAAAAAFIDRYRGRGPEHPVR
jgi:hypothetical protein